MTVHPTLEEMMMNPELAFLLQDENRLLAMIPDGLSKNTRRAYTKSVRDFMPWALENRIPNLDTMTALAFMEDQKRTGRAIRGNVDRAMLMHIAAGLQEQRVFDHRDVALLDYDLKIKVPSPRPRSTVTAKELGVFLRSFGDSLKDKRDRAMSWLCTNGLRPVQIIGLTVDSLNARTDGRLEVASRNHLGKAIVFVVSEAARQAVDDWLEAGRITEGRLFRQVNKHGCIEGDGLRGVKAVWVSVDKAASRIGMAGISPDVLRETGALIDRLQETLRVLGGDARAAKILRVVLQMLNFRPCAPRDGSLPLFEK